MLKAIAAFLQRKVPNILRKVCTPTSLFPIKFFDFSVLKHLYFKTSMMVVRVRKESRQEERYEEIKSNITFNIKFLPFQNIMPAPKLKYNLRNSEEILNYIIMKCPKSLTVIWEVKAMLWIWFSNFLITIKPNFQWNSIQNSILDTNYQKIT